MPKAVVVLAGAPLLATPRLVARVAALDRPYVIAADSGAATASAFGLEPDLVIGDLDSLDEGRRAELQSRNIPFETYPSAKDATDGQLALARALQEGPGQLFLLGFVNGPRLDMTVANVLLLAHAPSGTILLDERNECVLLKGPTEYGWQAEPQEMISLLPLGADVGGVLTHGLLYPLREESLTFGDTRGVSNEATQREVRVSLQQGTLLIVRHFPRL